MGLGLVAIISKWLSRLRKETPPPVELNLVDQLALSFLLRFDTGKVDDVYANALAIRPLVTRAELVVSLRRLSEIGIIELLISVGGPPGERVYKITKRGKKLRGIIPVEPRSAMDVWV